MRGTLFEDIGYFPNLLGFGRSVLEITEARSLRDAKNIMYNELYKYR